MIAWLAVTVDGRWHPGIGDPDFLGWFTTVAYLVVAGMCAWAWRREKSTKSEARNPKQIINQNDEGGLMPGFWLGIMVGMFLLGVNKQLDLQTWLTQEGRDMARSQGWYENRRPVQAGFIGVIVVMGAAGVGGMMWWLRGSLRRYRVAVVGVIYLVCFVIVRAASFHHIDRLLHVGLDHVRVNHVLELGGIGLIGWGAGRVAWEGVSVREKDSEDQGMSKA